MCVGFSVDFCGWFLVGWFVDKCQSTNLTKSC